MIYWFIQSCFIFNVAEKWDRKQSLEVEEAHMYIYALAKRAMVPRPETKERYHRASLSIFSPSLSLSILNSPDRGSHRGSRSRGISCVASELRFVFRCLPRRNSRPDSYVRILGPRAQQLADLLGRLARRFLVKEILFSRR